MDTIVSLSFVVYFIIGGLLFLFLRFVLRFSLYPAIFLAITLVALLLEFPLSILIIGGIWFFKVRKRSTKYYVAGVTILLVFMGSVLSYDDSVHDRYIKKIVKLDNMKDYLKEDETNKYGFDITIDYSSNTYSLPSHLRDKTYTQYDIWVSVNKEFWTLSKEEQFDTMAEIAKTLKGKEVEFGLYAGYYGEVTFSYFELVPAEETVLSETWSIAVNEDELHLNDLTRAEWIQSKAVAAKPEEVQMENEEVEVVNKDDAEVETEEVVVEPEEVQPNQEEEAVEHETEAAETPTTETSEETSSSESPYYYQEITYEDGSYYKGNLVDGVYHGYGILVWADGTKYDGDFANGYMHGHGWLVYSDGTEYTGEFLNDLPNGTGEMIWPDGTMFSGTFKDGSYTEDGVWGSLE